MSFAKAEQLLELAGMAAARRAGVALTEVEERFGVSRRTAQRMLRALEGQFQETETLTDDEGRRRWRLAGTHFRELMSLSADELAALDFAIMHLDRSGHDTAALVMLKDKVMSLIPRSRAASIETDHDALLEAQGFVARPGPRPRIDPATAAVVAEAIKGCRYIEFEYRSQRDDHSRVRVVAPYGLLSGTRRYLVGMPKDEPDGTIRSYRMDVICDVKLAEESFVRPPDFDIRAFSNRAFGAYERGDEYGDVIWRFVPEAAEHARGYLFHPEQTVEDAPDGSLIVRFKASGHLEMCWHLYAWGNKVEVIAPHSLREMVAGHQRTDFVAMP